MYCTFNSPPLLLKKAYKIQRTSASRDFRLKFFFCDIERNEFGKEKGLKLPAGISHIRTYVFLGPKKNTKKKEQDKYLIFSVQYAYFFNFQSSESAHPDGLIN